MPRVLVESYVSRGDARALQRQVPEEETRPLYGKADSAHAVREAAQRAEMAFEPVSDMVADLNDRHSDPGP